jgi:two-component system, chemotaxis family, CheB/CheR fusion protein
MTTQIDDQVNVSPAVEPFASFVAGVGASAGGLESLERFFRAIPPDSGIAFVVVQHLSADHKSLMRELLGRFATIPVVEARNGEGLRPNHIYILSPGKEIEVRRNSLAVFERSSDKALAFPIDRMLSSLAEAYGPAAIGVILSGSGSDGSRGARRVEAAGGLMLVEDPLLATFDGMPRAAIETGTASAVMSAEALAQAVCDHVATGALAESEEMSAVEELVRLLQVHLNADFRDYKRGTIHRRASRRSVLKNLTNLREYSHLVSENLDELQLLRDDLLIGVTSFFRNPEWFVTLQEEVGRLVTSPIEPTRELRAWCAGCATGEEAYSLAILFDEAIRRSGKARTFKVFATDIHTTALEAASSGVFASDRFAHMSPARLRDYFTLRSDGAYQVVSSLRHKIVFAKHDLLKDTPFTNLDVVSCRNMLIYLKLGAQRRALASLAYGLRIGGVLFLGSSETPGDLTRHFEAISETGKLFRKQIHSRAMQRPELSTKVQRRTAPLAVEVARPETRLLPVYDALLDRFMPPSFLLSEQRALLDSYCGAEELLQFSKRRPSNDFFDLIPPSARSLLAGLFIRAQREQGPVSAYPLIWPVSDGRERRFKVRAERMTILNAEPTYLISLMEETSAEPEPTRPETHPTRTDEFERFTQLESDLAHARTTLQATVEEVEASNEELQATNEELVASNEELQSVNEELHSVNEELHTVNAEHQLKIAELTELNRDIGHLLESIDVATIYLDRELKIRKYTPLAGEIFGLVEHDIGRYLASFNHQLHYPHLMADVQSLRDGGPRVEKEVRGRNDRWYFVRLLSYRIEGAIEGVVVTVTDATALASAKERALQLSAIVESSGDAIIGMNLDGIVVSWNPAAKKMYGYTSDEMVGQSIMKIVPEAERASMRTVIAQTAMGEERINIAAARINKSGDTLAIAKTISPVRDAQGVAVGIATIDRDIRVQKELERRLRESERRYEDLYNNAPDMYLSVATRTGRVLEFNETFLRVSGFSREEVTGIDVLDLYPQASQEAARSCFALLREGQPVQDVALKLKRKNGESLDVTLSATTVFASDGSVVGARTLMRDVSSRRHVERELARTAQMREQFLAMVSHELRSPLHAMNAAFQLIDQPDAEPWLKERSQAVVRRQSRQMTRLVDDLLDVSRILHDKLHIARVPLDLGDVVRSALDSIAPAFHRQGVQLLTAGFDAALPLFGDAGRLEQVLGNLLQNALKHTPAGRTVRVTCEHNAEKCAISVADEGRGIAAEDLDNIFDMFTQSRQELARSEGGLGLGLTIAHRILTAHGATITAKSDGPGRGACFTVEFTLDRAAATVSSTPVTMEGALTIVLVEDQEDAREMLESLLTLEGHQVHSASDGRDGLRVILERCPHVGLLDIGLPEMNGYQVAQAVREALGSSVKLIAMSGYGQPEDVRKAEEAGFDRHLTKPVDTRRLALALKEIANAR